MPLPARQATRMVALAAMTLAACRPAATGDAQVAMGGCLGRVCLGMSEKDALRALGPAVAGVANAAAAGSPAPDGPAPDRRHCYHLRDGAFYSFWVDEEDPARRVTGVLTTGVEHCADPLEIADAGTLATCRGVRLGDSDAFVAKMDRRAVETEKPGGPWPEAPEGTRQLDDDCGAGAPASRMTSLYLAGGKVEGLAVWEADR